MQRGELAHEAWRGMAPDVFFAERVLHDICGLYYSLTIQAVACRTADRIAAPASRGEL
jgi:hypothetical protein